LGLIRPRSEGHAVSNFGTTETREVAFYEAAQKACVESVFAARMCRAINNANILCLGAMIWGEWMAKEAVDVFLTTKHTDGLPHIKDSLLKSAEEVNRIDESTRKK
jgi:ribose 5-phosphate isomerase RpiB